MIIHDGDSREGLGAKPRSRHRVATMLYLLVILAFVVLVVKEFRRAVRTQGPNRAPAASAAVGPKP